MVDQNIDDRSALMDGPFFQMMTANGNFEIAPCDNIVGIENRADFTRLELTSAQKIHVGALLQQIPSAMAVGTIAQAYTVNFPKGLPHTLMQLKDGGVANPIIDVDGKIIDWASFHSISTQAVILGAFTAMSIASSQYFLSQINSELKMMKLNLDKILEFLYGDKKAELMAEVSFVKYAYRNYRTIMAHGQQRTATITSLQESKKVAMKDIEFYMSDLNSTVNSKNNSDIISQIDKAFQIKESLEFSMQLYGMSSLLEVYYAQNHDSDYLRFVGDDLLAYIDKCEKRMLSSFSILGKNITDYKGKLWEKIDKSSYEKQVQEFVDLLNSGEESIMRKTFHSALTCAKCSSEYYFNTNGDVYLKAS